MAEPAKQLSMDEHSKNYKSDKSLDDILKKYKTFTEDEAPVLLDSISNSLMSSYKIVSEGVSKHLKKKGKVIDLNTKVADIEDDLEKLLFDAAEQELKTLYPEQYEAIKDLDEKHKKDAVFGMHASLNKDKEGNAENYSEILKDLKKNEGTVNDLLMYFRNVKERSEGRLSYYSAMLNQKLFSDFHQHDFIKYIHKTARAKGHDYDKHKVVTLERPQLIETARRLDMDMWDKDSARRYGIHWNKNKKKIYDNAEKYQKAA